jgi:hypothetical protein
MRLPFAVVVGTWLAASTVGAQPRTGAATSSDDQSTFLTSAPLEHLFADPGNGRFSAKAMGGHLSPRPGSSSDSTAIFGGMVSGIYQIDPRFFVTGLGIFAKGEVDRLSASLYGGFVAGGARLVGSKEDVFILSAALGLGGLGSSIQLGDRLREINVKGLGAVLLLQAEIAPIPWVSIVPHAEVYRLMTVSVDRGGVRATSPDLKMTWFVPGLDVWIYTDPKERRSHFGLGGSASVGQDTKTEIFQISYTFAFGS